ncbi:MAG: hypothetical protein JWN48_3011 [Myxococcaceae bacterium]|nr:hypothetical protein [Myxococcaceae bacterium]
MKPHALTYCARCTHEVDAVRPWPGYVWVKRGWYSGAAIIFALTPIIFSELTVLMPLACAFGLAGGPIHSLAAQKATCRECGALVN